MTAPTVRYAWKLLRAGPLRLDGGSMFGVVPGAVWKRRVACDEQGRIELAHNCLLLRPCPPESGGLSRRDASMAGSGWIVIETGSGDKFDERDRRIFGLD